LIAWNSAFFSDVLGEREKERGVFLEGDWKAELGERGGGN